MKDIVNASSRRPRSWWLWIGAWALLAVATHVPPNRALEKIGGADRVVHFLAYLSLAGLGAYHLRRSRSGSTVAALVGWAAVYFAFAALDEWLQQFVRRTPDFRDWLADAGGVTVATGLAVVRELRSRARLSEPAPRRS